MVLYPAIRLQSKISQSKKDTVIFSEDMNKHVALCPKGVQTFAVGSSYIFGDIY